MPARAIIFAAVTHAAKRDMTLFIIFDDIMLIDITPLRHLLLILLRHFLPFI